MDWLARLYSIYNVVQPLIDIGILAFFIYKSYEVLVKTQAVQLMRGILFVVGVYALAFILSLSTLTWILNLLAPGVIIALAILFQPELRKVFMRLGQGDWFRLSGSRPRASQIEAVISAAELLSSHRRGGLIAFPRKVPIKNVIDTGTRLSADLSSALILSIFGHDTPLHDGAIVVQNGKILAAGCLLPLSEQLDIRRSFGTRHRAALGLSEESDAVVLVISEESGALSLASDSKLHYNLQPADLRRKLEELLGITGEAPSARAGEESGGDE